MKKTPGQLLAWLRDASLRAAELNVVIGEDMAQRLKLRDIAADHIAVAHNWADDDVIRPIDPSDNPLRAEWGLTDKFVVAYSGNLGRAHEVETLLGAAALLKDRPDVVFLFIGGGHGAELVQAHVREAGLTNFVFKPYQPREALAQSLSVGDVHWLSLKPGLDGLLLPSKFYGIAAAGRPAIIIGAPEGELARLVETERCGVAIAPGQSKKLARVLASLAEDRARCDAMGRRIRQLLDQRFSKVIALERWTSLLNQVAVGANRDAMGE